MKAISLCILIGLLNANIKPNDADLKFGNPSWSLDGRTILFDSNKDDDDRQLNKLYTVASNGTLTTVAKLTEEVLNDWDGEWLPSTPNTIVFVAGVNLNNDIYKIANNKAVQLTFAEEDEISPSCSPAGDIVFVSNNKIFIMDSNGKHMRPVKNIKGAAFDPVWISTTSILYASKLKGLNTLCRIDSSGENYEAIEWAGNRSQPAVSKDGKIAFVSNKEDGKNNIYVMKNLKDNSPVQITSSGDENNNPAWSPNGKEIAYASKQNKTWGIYVFNTETKIERKVYGN